MADGDVGNVNPNLLSKLQQTSAAEWREERRRAFQARRAGLSATPTAAASYLPKDYDENAPDEGAAVGSSSGSAKPSAAPVSAAGAQQNLDMLKGLVAARAAAAKPTAPVPATQPPAVAGEKRPREEDAAPSAPAGGLKAALLARLAAMKEAEAKGTK